MIAVKFKKEHLKEIIIILILSLTPLIFCGNLITEHPVGTDIGFHFYRMGHTSGTLKIFGFFPRWVEGYSNGLPYYITYPPLADYIVAIISFLTGNFEVVFRIFIVIIFCLSPVALNFFVKKLSSSKLAGFLSGFFYILAPTTLRLLGIIGPYTWYVGLFFVFLFFYFFVRFFKENKKIDFVFTILFLSAAVLSHVYMVWIVLVFVVSYVLSEIIFSRKLNKKVLINLIKIIVFSFLISSFWYIPYLTNLNSGGISYDTTNVKLNLKDLLVESSVFYYIGFFYLFGSIIFLVLFTIRFNIKENKFFIKFKKINQSLVIFILYSVIFFVFGLCFNILSVLNTERNIHHLTIGLCIIIGISLASLLKNIRTKYKILILIIFILTFPFLFHHVIRFEESNELAFPHQKIGFLDVFKFMSDEGTIRTLFKTNIADKYFDGKRVAIASGAGSDWLSPYIPYYNGQLINNPGVKWKSNLENSYNITEIYKVAVESGTQIIYFMRDDIKLKLFLNSSNLFKLLDSVYQGGIFEVINTKEYVTPTSNNSKITWKRENPHKIILNITNNEIMNVTILETYDKNWKLSLDGNPKEILESEYGFMFIDNIPEGNHNLVFEFGWSVEEIAGIIISLIGILLLFIYVLKFFK